jgi:hypothetical protein
MNKFNIFYLLIQIIIKINRPIAKNINNMILKKFAKYIIFN